MFAARSASLVKNKEEKRTEGREESKRGKALGRGPMFPWLLARLEEIFDHLTYPQWVRPFRSHPGVQQKLQQRLEMRVTSRLHWTCPQSLPLGSRLTNQLMKELGS
jgi:hypothetical protein